MNPKDGDLYLETIISIFNRDICRDLPQAKRWEWLEGMEYWIFAGEGTICERVTKKDIGSPGRLAFAEPSLMEKRTFLLAESLIPTKELEAYKHLLKQYNGPHRRNWEIYVLWTFLKDMS